MWPRPRPDSLAIGTPQAATSGATTSVALSPTPPVECLSTTGRPTADMSSRSPESHHRREQRVGLGVAQPLHTTAIRNAAT